MPQGQYLEKQKRLRDKAEDEGLKKKGKKPVKKKPFKTVNTQSRKQLRQLDKEGY